MPVGSGKTDPAPSPHDNGGTLDAGIQRSPSITIVPPPACVSTVERCDQADNDCDGVIDEQVACTPIGAPSTCTPKLWYRDCDGDGYATNASGSVSSCELPPPPEQCRGWTNVEPTVGKIDCNDNSIAYAPGVDFGIASGSNGGDRNCDGTIELRVVQRDGPKIVDRKPRDDAAPCRYEGRKRRPEDCECWGWEELTREGASQPTCAENPELEHYTAHYWAWYGFDDVPRSCQGAVTFATGTIDFYQVYVSCR